MLSIHTRISNIAHPTIAAFSKVAKKSPAEPLKRFTAHSEDGGVG